MNGWSAIPPEIPWLIWLLLFVFFGPIALGSKVAARWPGVLGAYGRWRQARRLRAADADRADRNAARLAALEIDMREMQTTHVRQLDVMQAQLDAQAAQLEAQAATIAQLRVAQAATDATLTEVSQKFWDAIGYIRRLADALAHHAEVPEPPARLKELLG
ncbi:hypothetical protein MINS_12660 [Mycolicibacterium insubricum]|uniref:Uncharacterized protein n=1 Tax=Mycolicibacterium insubricum TaxID=444597 RepID=A0A1X0D7Z1_9MYCO|nr:hypothetical protein [Mycolicibacterium insubricum]ORA68525.1 hypothetical protein BST26_14345 [Mycolicibacterium insubricum]BBZ65837.1 hypothetical protein MINS_12660 [Mycolicibacterium insubricum]